MNLVNDFFVRALQFELVHGGIYYITTRMALVLAMINSSGLQIFFFFSVLAFFIVIFFITRVLFLFLFMNSKIIASPYF